mmetsp:Transcript_10246/g.12965  ORF Transcript_10246/g.12965 Transcript_10246/m.12965 type:complete len:105 (-) Transcript_10246:575-889(-)
MTLDTRVSDAVKEWLHKDDNMQREYCGQEREPLGKLWKEIEPEKSEKQIENSISLQLCTYHPLIKPERTPKVYKPAKVGKETSQQGSRLKDNNKKNGPIYREKQ